MVTKDPKNNNLNANMDGCPILLCDFVDTEQMRTVNLETPFPIAA